MSAPAPCGCSIAEALGGRTELGTYCERCGVAFDELDQAELELDERTPNKNTRRAYAGDLRAWEAFATVESGVPAWPVPPATLLAWARSMASLGRRAATIRRRVSTVMREHRDRGLGECTVPGLAAMLRTRAQREDRNRKAPITPELLAAGLPAMSVRDRALLLVGWSLALRRSELTSLRWADVLESRGEWSVLLRRSKTDAFAHGCLFTIWPLDESARDLCPVRAVTAWRSTVDTDVEPLLFPLHPGTVARAVKQLVAAAGGMPGNYSAHSLRSGAITTAVSAGVSLPETMELSRHTSASVALGYVQLAPRRLPAMEALLVALSQAKRPHD